MPLRPVRLTAPGMLAIVAVCEGLRMYNESIVYGYIRDLADDYGGRTSAERRAHNRRVLELLPPRDHGTLVFREMFAITGGEAEDNLSALVHFSCSGLGLEYEWKHWMREFEAMLANMYWYSAIVHLETELAGKHTFCWDAQSSLHSPSQHDLSVRCEWSREGVFA